MFVTLIFRVSPIPATTWHIPFHVALVDFVRLRFVCCLCGLSFSLECCTRGWRWAAGKVIWRRGPSLTSFAISTRGASSIWAILSLIALRRALLNLLGYFPSFLSSFFLFVVFCLLFDWSYIWVCLFLFPRLVQFKLFLGRRISVLLGKVFNFLYVSFGVKLCEFLPW